MVSQVKSQKSKVKSDNVILVSEERAHPGSAKNKDDSGQVEDAGKGTRMTTRYIPANIESKWQEKWKKEGIYKFNQQPKNPQSPKYYPLVEWPYPSGDLHIGHWFSFATADVHARCMRMLGKNVFFTNGFDAFGLPAENAAIKRGIHPKDWTYSNIENMRKQFGTMGTMIDWEHSAIACDPSYYKWNQWIFIRMFEKGLAYRGKMLGNWCPTDQTVLANEHAEGGKCWRCGTEVVQKEVEQWFIKLTALADELLWPNPTENVILEGAKRPIGSHQKQQDSIASLQNDNFAISSTVDWPVSVKVAQNQWIGKKEGIEIIYDIEGSTEKVTVFTTRPETNFGATFIAIAPEHPLVKKITSAKQKKEVDSYIKDASKKTELERMEEGRQKSGAFTGMYAINELNNYKMPIWVSDFVLMGFGTGALVGVPGHDKRDFEFAEAFGLDVKRVVVGNDGDVSEIKSFDQVQEEDGKMINSHFLNNMDIHRATKEMMNYMEEKGYGKRSVNYHIHDWSISRQRYWGTPVPFIYCKNCFSSRHPGEAESLDRIPSGDSIASSAKQNPLQNDKLIYGRDYITIDGENYAMIPVPDDQLPVELPYDVDYTPKGKAPLATNEKWMAVKCPKCQGKARRDPETLDTFFDSSWYFFRYLDPKFVLGPFPKDLASKLTPVDIYFGGAEHTLGHTLYARFFTRFFKMLGLIDFDEFALKRVQHGVILGTDGLRMSKSKGNVVNPDDVVREFGADAARLYLCFMMPYSSTAPWDPKGIWGVYKFLKRVWELQYEVVGHSGAKQSEAIESRHKSKGSYQSAFASLQDDNLTDEDLHQMHKAIKKVSDDIKETKFNTAVSTLMIWLNHLEKKIVDKKQISIIEYKNLLIILAPFAPHITEELFQLLKGKGERRKEKNHNKLNPLPLTLNAWSIHQQSWPEIDKKYLVENTVTLAVQVNGKLRHTLVLSTTQSQEEIESLAKQSEKITKYLQGKKIKKTIFVPGRILNFVLI